MPSLSTGGVVQAPFPWIADNPGVESLSEEKMDKGVVTASTANYALAVATACGRNVDLEVFKRILQ